MSSIPIAGQKDTNQAEKNKAKVKMQLVENLAQVRPQDVNMCSKTLMEKISDGQARNHRIKLQPDTFRRHMITKCGEGCTFGRLSFGVGDNF